MQAQTSASRLAPALLAAVLAMGVLMPPAHAQDDIKTVELGFAERKGKLVIQELGMSSILFDENAYHKLEENALPTVIVMRFYVYRKGRQAPVAYRLMTVRIVYDVWLEDYEVRIDSPLGRDSGRFDRLDQAYRTITEFTNLPIAELADIAIGPHHYLALVAELNPVSRETLAEVRRWVTRPAGATSLDRGTSIFGSFVSIFVNAKLPEADRVVRARSQPFYRIAR